MITDFLLDHSALVPGVLALVGLLCAVIGHATLRRYGSGSRVLWALAGSSLLVVVALTLAPTGRGASGRDCTVQFALPTLGSVELLANVALLLPAALFAALATRRPAAVAVAGSLLSAAIEAAQALAPAVGRACDTNDWLMNSLGVVTGVLLAGATIALTDRTAPGRSGSELDA
ncbi:VanZ family protein [Blastococcus sp. SYSU DS0617]